MTQTRILVVKDDAAMRREVVDAFTASGYTVLKAADRPRGLQKALSADPELVLLDVMLPELDGIEVLRTGADDYVVKPFSVVELMALGRAPEVAPWAAS